jgi:tetratricopeptide (TPR) repeat protein/transcriptional regulator with XRE-family HTH domain
LADLGVPSSLEWVDGRPAAHIVLRALREARGVTQESWAGWLGYSVATVRRWESGAATPPAETEAILFEHCEAGGLFRTYDRGPLRGLTLTPQVLRDVLAESRIARTNKTASSARTDLLVATEGYEVSPLAKVRWRAPLVGRQQELYNLNAEFGAVVAGDSGRVVMISGDPGVGKTRLAHELRPHADLVGARYLEGQYLRTGNTAYGPWVDCLRVELASRSRADVLKLVAPYGGDLAPIIPEVALHVEPATGHPLGSAIEQRQRLCDGIATLLRNLSRQAPLVLLLDDLQWAPDLILLQHVARRLDGSRVLLIGTYREMELRAHGELVRELAELNRAQRFLSLRLSPLNETETAELLMHFIGPQAADQLRNPVHRQTRGNPFFTEEVVRSLVETGAVRSGTDGWQVVDATVSIPESMKLAVEDRLAHVELEVRDVLSQASVLGSQFGLSVLQRMVGATEDDLLDRISEAQVAQLLLDRTEPGDERYAFRDDQIQEVLYASIPTPRCRRYHLRAGEAYEAVYEGQLDAHVDELARHFVEGNDLERGARYAEWAGDTNDRVFNWQGAIPLYRQALDFLESLGGRLDRKAALYEKLGDICYRSTLDARLGLKYYEEALNLYQRLGDQERIGALHVMLGREYILSGNLEISDAVKAVQHLHLARSLLEEGAPSPSLFSVYYTLAWAHAHHLNQFGEIATWSDKALNVAKELQDPQLVASASAMAGSGWALTGNVARGLQALEEAWQVAIEHGFAADADLCRVFGAGLGMQLRWPRLGLGWIARKPDFGTMYATIVLPCAPPGLYALLGELESGVQSEQAFRGALDGVGQTIHAVWPAYSGLLQLRRGEFDSARDFMQAALDWATASHSPNMILAARQRLGEIHLDRGDENQAEEQLLGALELCREGGHVLDELAVLPRLCELYAARRDIDRAAESLSAAQGYLIRDEQWGGIPGDVALAECLVRAAQERWQEAQAAYERAVAIDQQFELTWDIARAQYAWARACWRRPDRGDATWRDSMVKLLSAAETTWLALGAAPHAARCHELLEDVR